ncbi:MAG: purine-nucleoside phosphorylase [Endomicrobiaceae bacterium]|jgi:purine-nucleoside phosphorylase|nr:purine-nucleoside phosphorylase [Endomicrobiaceae bacterium]MDD3729572.1 purine-nucleoside phosphorylase [Endomicrobiaceae bacterium]MDD4165636.1 purine-nucleoside phosphorylase [Endomicrobiaceae bacterium]
MKKQNILLNLKKTKSYIIKFSKFKPKTAIILGSGLSGIKDLIKEQTSIPYSKIPGFKQTTVKGHKGELVFGKINDKEVLLLNGRFHYYEGNSMNDITYPIRVIKELGINTLIITCAAGAINKKYSNGDIVVIKDHINFMFDNPLIGEHFEYFGERFPDLSAVYDINLINSAKKAARTGKIKLHTGVYFAVKGPSYETASEISAFRKLGADVIGMSLAPEAIVAGQANMKVLALAYVSNKAAGVSKNKTTHCEVLDTGKKTGIKMANLIKNILKDIV